MQQYTQNRVEARMIERLDRRIARAGGVMWWAQRPQRDERIERVLARWGKGARV